MPLTSSGGISTYAMIEFLWLCLALNFDLTFVEAEDPETDDWGQFVELD